MTRGARTTARSLRRCRPERRRLRADQRAHRESHAVLLTRADRARRCRTRRSSAPAGLAESTFADPARGGIPLRARSAGADRPSPTLAPSAYPPSGRRVLHRLRAPVRAARAVRDLRLRGDEPDARRDQPRATDGGRTQARRSERRRGAVRDPRSPQRARHLHASTATATPAHAATACTGSSTGD